MKLPTRAHDPVPSDSAKTDLRKLTNLAFGIFDEAAAAVFHVHDL